MAIAIGIGVVLLLWFVISYNGMVSKRNAVKTGYANIDVELKRRYDLIPNLVETAKKYMSHESQTLTAVVAARSDAVSALAALRSDPFDQKAIENMKAAESKVQQTLYSLKVTAEAYPNLKADGLMMQTMAELADTENRIAFMRQNYNDLVMNYNTAIEVFPTVIIANNLNFKAATQWSIERQEERESVRVNFAS